MRFNCRGVFITWSSPADDVGDVHVQVVDDDPEVVGRHAVAAGDDEVVELAVVERHGAPHQVFEDDLPFRRVPEPDDGLDPGRRCLGPAAAPPVVAGFFATRALPGPHRLELFPAAIAVVRLAVAQQALDVLLVERQPIGLEEGTFVGVEPQPSEPVHDRIVRRPRRTLAVGVLDPEHERAAPTACEKPVEQGGAGAADVKEPGRAGRESGADVHGRRIHTSRTCAATAGRANREPGSHPAVRSFTLHVPGARSSVGEHRLHTAGVAGSIPAAPTNHPPGGGTAE